MNPKLGTILHSEATAWSVLAVSIVITAMAWFVSNTFLERDAEERFNAAVQRARHNISERMTAYQEILRAGAGLVDSSEHVTRGEWKAFVEALQIDRTYPGIQGLGYAVMVPPARKAALEASVRGEGFPDFAIWPAGRRDPYSAIVYLEPFDWRNRRAFGYDMFSEPVRREAMERARDTGQIAMSARVILVQETGRDVQMGTLLYMPIYRGGQRPATVAGRRAALEAFVYSPFRIGDLMRGILGLGLPQLHFELYDGAPGDDALMYRFEALMERNNGSLPARTRHRPRFTADIPIDVAGRRWTARFTSSTHFEEAVSSAQPALIAAGGLLADLLLFATLFSVSRSRRILACERERFHAAVEAAPVAMLMVDAEGRIVLANENAEQLFGYAREALIGRKIDMLIPDDARERHAAFVRGFMTECGARRMGAGRDIFGRRKDGTNVAVEIGLGSVETDAGRFVIAAITDITERKAFEAERARAEETIRDMAFHDSMTQLPNRRLLSDRMRQAMAAARRTRRHGALLFIDLDNFKSLNDSLGHDMGDKLLVEVARRLEECVRYGDTVARLGGDEFVVMLTGLSEEVAEATAQARQVGRKILDALNEPYRLDAHVHRSSPSIGATLFMDDREDMDAILKRADAAMYQVKASGRNALRFFDADG
ncbi:MAG: CHASE domain-containing protein [Candidatus Nitricoxidivorans perseverans]|uniref:CHASE domain-containing protein n=1 Tax=Candidatus Nitricoxidivorans perseverans TaxID=2975601 RepID=A0AA49FMK7_9PROT|nr:MAG: CHASE domain-containing protein [Candidatus Nitricoxidivorans perseverans]